VETTTGPTNSASPSIELDRLRLVLLRLARSIRTNSAGDITPSQMAVLATLNNRGPRTIGQIAELEQVKPPSASKIVAALERADLVEREADPSDRRCTVIAVTPSGRAHIERARAAGRSWLAGRLDDLDDDDLDLLSAALPALERLLGGGA
jgi:DNA-binding MarR family transcriptional regulator